MNVYSSNWVLFRDLFYKMYWHKYPQFQDKLWEMEERLAHYPQGVMAKKKTVMKEREIKS